jgi:hypothetical protein
MRKIKYILFVMLLIIFLCGCERFFNYWKYDPDKLKVGMTFNEVKGVWGEPSSYYITSEYVFWTYEDYYFGDYSSRYESYTLTFKYGILKDWTIYRSTD